MMGRCMILRLPGQAVPALLSLLFAGFLSAAPPGLRAQEPAEAIDAATGVVVDAATGAPIAFALVKAPAPDLTVATDAEGRFSLAGLGVGPVSLEVSHLGYADAVVEWAGQGAAPLRVALMPNPIELQGLKVMTSRFAHRRNAVPISVSVLSGEAVATYSGNALELLQSRAPVMITTCAGSAENWAQWCVLSRGQRLAPRVYVDEFRAFEGLYALSFIDARALHSIEVFAQGRHVRAYTRAFMERMANRPEALIPLSW